MHGVLINSVLVTLLSKSLMKRILLISLGWLAVILGFFGIFLPLLPTVPFILLAMYCFGASSPRFYRWLETNKLFGPVVARIRRGLGLTLREKVRILLFTWTSIGLTVCFVIDNVHLRIMLVGILLIQTWYISRAKTFTEQEATM
ncbi:hypothetical protein VISI1226_03995 [Vibrio sinaloensis DSM 21326]|uniref:Inner membrane protein n=2 Tax=Photobacterium sp. (strain ATCC 43367) TaxID=379097 RepID=E8MCK5_PHOS4|nr:hypothetical protein VISI1226_03995 [Vibrio sinaloensis DSM 21326]